MPSLDRLSPWWAVLAGLAVLLAAALLARGLLVGGDPAPAPDRIVRVVRPPATPEGPPPRSEPAGEPSHPGTDRLGRAGADRLRSEREAGDPAAEPYVRLRPGREALLRDRPGGDVVAKVDDRTEFGSPTVLSVRRVRDRWLGVPTPALPNGELGWLRANPATLLGGYTDIRVDVDLSRHRAAIWDGSELLRRWTVTVGAPGTPTPTGTFAVTDLIERGLNPVYGCCAVALTAKQPEVPSGWQGGNRIAFHGTDGPLGVDASNGCIRSADPDVRALMRTVPLGAPVRIHE